MIDVHLPESSRPEHLELHDQLSRARRVGGRTAEAATAVMTVLYPHILLEERYAMPPLALLPQLISGEVTEDMRRVVKAAEKLKAELPSMLEDHRRIVKALKDFMQASTDEGHGGHAQFAQKIIHHAQQEEEMLYPAAILVGEYIKLRLGKA